MVQHALFHHSRNFSLDLIQTAHFSSQKLQLNSNGPWYTCQKMGENPVGNLMKKISEEARLSHLYTNHCLRASSAAILAISGLQGQEIMKVTDHKNAESVKHYINAPTTAKQKSVRALLHTNCTCSINIIIATRQEYYQIFGDVLQNFFIISDFKF